MKKKFCISIILVILYYFLSIFLSKNGQFFQYNRIISLDEEQSKYNKTLLKNNFDDFIIKDSLDILKSDFTMWIDKNKYKCYLGFLPIYITRIESDSYYFNIKKNDLSTENISVKVNDSESVILLDDLGFFLKFDIKYKIFFIKNDHVFSEMNLYLKADDADL